MAHLQHLLLGLIDHYGYAGLFLAMLLGNIGAPVGAEVLMPLAGGLVATGHLSSIWATIAVAVLGELAGGSIGYAIGRYGGVPFFERYGKFVHFGHEQLEVVHGFFARWGTFAIFICRFVPVVRGIVGFPAGIARMNLAQFYLWTCLGSLVFCGVLIELGATFGTHIHELLPLIHRGGFAVLLVALVVVAGIVAVVRVRSRRARAARVE